MTTEQQLPELTGKQRQTIRKFFEEHPDGGYKTACREAGILRLTKQQAKTLIETDDELSDVREKALGVDEDSAWKRVADIAKNAEHKDALRANTFILGAIHGRTEQARLQIAGDPEAPLEVLNPDVTAAVERFAATVAAAAARNAARTDQGDTPPATD